MWEGAFAPGFARGVAVVAVLAAGCARQGSFSEEAAPGEARQSILSSAGVLGFETAEGWTAGAQLSTSPTRVEGESSLQVVGTGWSELVSVPLSSLGSVSTIASMNIRLSQPVGWGEVRLILQVPSIGIWWADLGGRSIAGISAGAWQQLDFDVSPYRGALQGAYADATLRIVLNGPPNTYLLDDLTFDAASCPTCGPVQDEGRILTIALPQGRSLQSTAIWSNAGVWIADGVAVLKPQGGRGAIVNVGSDECNLGVDSSVGDVTCGANTILRERANIVGSLYTGGSVSKQNGVTISGETVEGRALGKLSRAQRLVSFPGNAPPLLLEAGTSLSPVPGTYGALTVRSGATCT